MISGEGIVVSPGTPASTGRLNFGFDLSSPSLRLRLFDLSLHLHLVDLSLLIRLDQGSSVIRHLARGIVVVFALPAVLDRAYAALGTSSFKFVATCSAASAARSGTADTGGAGEAEIAPGAREVGREVGRGRD